MVLEKIDYLKDRVEQDPENNIRRAELVTKLIDEGQLDRARKWIKNTLNDLDPTWPMIKEFHRPVLDTLLQKGEIEHIQPLILHMNKHFPEEPRVKRMSTKARTALTQQMSASVFPGDIPVSNWWDGPHLVSEEHLSEWIPGQIIDIEDGMVTIHVASLGEHSQLEESEWEMPFNQIKEFSKNSPPDGEYLYSRLEIGIYNDDKVEIKFHQE